MRVDRCSTISVIIPIYKVHAYLGKCVESVIRQTYGKLEVILVDDGSPDDCPALCDAWALKDKRIKVIHKENGGLSDARNAGIEVAQGEYILFVDGDDYIAPNMCERLLAAVENSCAELAVCSFYWEYPVHQEVQPMVVPNGTVVQRSNILETWAKRAGGELIVAWNKLYRRELFFTPEHIRYPVGRLHEDEFTSYRLLYAAQNVVFIDEPLYHYVQRSDSIMANYGERNLRDFAEAVQEYIPWAKRYAPEKQKVMEYMTLRNTLDLVMRSADNPYFKYGPEICDRLRKYTEKYVQSFLCNPYASWKDKAKYLLFELHIFVFVMKIWISFKEFGRS